MLISEIARILLQLFYPIFIVYFSKKRGKKERIYVFIRNHYLIFKIPSEARIQGISEPICIRYGIT